MAGDGEVAAQFSFLSLFLRVDLLATLKNIDCIQ